MAFKAFVFLVLTSQRKDGVSRMIKAERILPLHFIVTRFTLEKRTLLGTHFFAITMIIRVTRKTGFLQSRPVETTRSFP